MRLKLAFFGLCLLTLMVTVQSQNTYIPYELGGDNYYTMYGGPALSASIAGTNEFERGDTVTLLCGFDQLWKSNGIQRGSYTAKRQGVRFGQC